MHSANRMTPQPSSASAAFWRRDFAMTWRRLRRAPLFVIATITTLTIGLGAFAVVFTAGSTRAAR